MTWPESSKVDAQNRLFLGWVDEVHQQLNRVPDLMDKLATLDEDDHDFRQEILTEALVLATAANARVSTIAVQIALSDHAKR